jgi:hypothetical protein
MPTNEAADFEQDRPSLPPEARVVVTRHEAGITLDFPLIIDDHLAARRRAWRFFEVGVFLLVGSVGCLAACRMAGWFALIPMLAVPFLAGIVALVAAANRMRTAWNDAHGVDFLCQLAVAGNLLIRTWRDQRKQIWYRQEIRTIKIEDKLESNADESEGCTTYLSTYAFQLVIELQSSKQLVLLADGSSLPAGLYRSKAELEWIAAQLKLALFPAGPETPGSDNVPSPHSIQKKVDYSERDRFTH